MNNIGSKLREAVQTEQLKLKFGHWYCRTLRDWGVSMDGMADIAMNGLDMRVKLYAERAWEPTT